jgi:ABC-type branched-subunit amino acid transport system ATPase component
MGKPAVVLLDEPAAAALAEAQDPPALIHRIAGEMGRRVLLIEHNVGLVPDLCHPVVVLDSGV